jgi:predicted Zn-dependent protease
MTDYVHTVDADEQAKIASFLRWFAVGSVLFIIAVIALFVTADRWLRLISIESERRFIEPYIDLLVETDIVESDPVLQAYVGDIVSDMHAQLGSERELELRVFVIEGSMINAFATLGGYIFVFDSLIEAVENENSLAMVLGHEIAHVHHRDPLLGTGRAMLIQLALSTFSGNGLDPNTVNVGSDVILNQYSREQELAADELALQLVQGRYEHVGGATRLFEVIRSDADDLQLAEFLSTHPDTDARIERIEALTAERGWSVDEPTPYPDAVLEALRD